METRRVLLTGSRFALRIGLCEVKQHYADRRRETKCRTLTIVGARLPHQKPLATNCQEAGKPQQKTQGQTRDGDSLGAVEG